VILEPRKHGEVRKGPPVAVRHQFAGQNAELTSTLPPRDAKQRISRVAAVAAFSVTPRAGRRIQWPGETRYIVGDCDLTRFFATCARMVAKNATQPTRTSMTVSMYKISVPIFVQFLVALDTLLEKTAAHCEAKKIEPAALLNARLFPDMFPLGRQVRAAVDHAVSASARLAGAEPLTFANAEMSFAELRERLRKAIDFVKGFKAEQIDGSEDKAIKITFPSGATRDFTGQSLLLNNALPNFYFHCTTAYDILRHCGVELGKRDFMGTPVSL
jgi:hypothetical protein